MLKIRNKKKLANVRSDGIKIGNYTDVEVKFLRENYSKYGAKYCASKLGRPAANIMPLARRLGLKVNERALRDNSIIKLAGEKFGKLTVLNEDPIKKSGNNLYWKCKCDCGNFVEVRSSHLLEGQKSCGCDPGGNYRHGFASGKNLSREYKMFSTAKRNAKNLKREFSITIFDINIPEFCPLLGIKLDKDGEKNADNLPSLDRIDNNLGYTKNNIWVISWKANRLKRDYSLNDIKILAENLEKALIEKKINEDRRDKE